MRVSTLTGVGLTVLLGGMPAQAADEETARTIMERVDARDDGDNATTDMEMVLIDRRGNERVRRLRSFNTDRGEDRLQIMFFLYPPDVEGTGFLTIDYGGRVRDDDQWLYLPALSKTKRIASSGKSGSFMGSDFSYADLTTRDLDDYDYTLLEEAEVRDHPVWVIEASLLLVRKDNDVVVRAVHWVEGGEDLRYMDVLSLELVEGIWVATEIHMTTKRNRETRHKTVLRLDDVRFNQDLPEELFTVHRLEKGP